jgi:hypothetical protein
MILERSCSSLKPLLRCNSNDDRWQLDLLTKYYACSVELICIDGFESLRSIEAKVLGQRSSSSQLDSDGFLFILPPWANTAPLVSSAMHRFASVASILLSHRDDHTETNDDHSSDIDESSSTLREASGLRLLFCPGLTEEDDSGSNSETPSMSGLVCRFLEERPRLSLEVLFAEESPAACEQMVPSRLVEALECIEWAHYTARMPSAAPNNSSSATLPSKDSEAAAAPESSQETSTNSQQSAACGLATTCKAPNTAPEADEESVEYGCELPPHMLMDPFTLTSYVCDVLVPRNSSSSQVDADDAAVTEKLMHLMNVVKKEGHRLRRAERQRQAKILAERLSLLMGE